MTQQQVNRILRFCKENKLPQPQRIGKKDQYLLRWIGIYNYAYSDYVAAMNFLVSLLKERESRQV